MPSFFNFYYCLHTGPDQPRGPPSGDSDREAYRRGPAPGMEPKGGAPSDFRPEFVRLHSLFIYCSLKCASLTGVTQSHHGVKVSFWSIAISSKVL